MNTNNQDRWTRPTGMDTAFNAMMIAAAVTVIAHAVATATTEATTAPQQVAVTAEQPAPLS